MPVQNQFGGQPSQSQPQVSAQPAQASGFGGGQPQMPAQNQFGGQQPQANGFGGGQGFGQAPSDTVNINISDDDLPF